MDKNYDYVLFFFSLTANCNTNERAIWISCRFAGGRIILYTVPYFIVREIYRNVRRRRQDAEEGSCDTALMTSM